MNGQANFELAHDFLQKLGQGDSQALSRLFAEDADWEIAGDTGALPWIGKKKDAKRLSTSFEIPKL
jgi:ketosteroid isomerase-like protein